MCCARSHYGWSTPGANPAAKPGARWKQAALIPDLIEKQRGVLSFREAQCENLSQPAALQQRIVRSFCGTRDRRQSELRLSKFPRNAGQPPANAGGKPRSMRRGTAGASRPPIAALTSGGAEPRHSVPPGKARPHDRPPRPLSINRLEPPGRQAPSTFPCCGCRRQALVRFDTA